MEGAAYWYGNHHGVKVLPMPQAESISGSVPLIRPISLAIWISTIVKETIIW